MIWMLFISFSCLISLARTFSTTMNRSGKSGSCFLAPTFRGKTLNLLTLSMMLAVGLSYLAFIILALNNVHLKDGMMQAK